MKNNNNYLILLNFIMKPLEFLTLRYRRLGQDLTETSPMCNEFHIEDLELGKTLGQNMKNLLALTVFLGTSISGLAWEPTNLDIKINLKAEMDPLPIETNQDWKHDCSQELPPTFYQTWTNIVDYTKEHISSDEIIELSRWAKKEMEGYHYSPSIKPAGFYHKGCTDKQTVYSTRLDYLPSHSPLVTRFIEMFVVTPIEAPLADIRQVEVFVTIRGVLME